jgi:uncharacterized protein
MKALITGASSDLGIALAKALHHKGYELLLTARTQPPLPFPFRSADLTQDRSPILSWIQEECPSLIINNAGAGLYGPAFLHSTKEQLDLLELNGKALLELTLESARVLQKKGKKGIILNIASAAGLFPYPTFSVYSASKGFVKTLSQALDAELKPQGIRVLVACPGQIATSFRQKASKGVFNKKTPLTLPINLVVKKLLKQIEREKPYSIIDYRYKILLALIRLLPLPLRNTLFLKSMQARWSCGE